MQAANDLMQKRHKFIAEVRRRGLFVAVRFGAPRSLKLKAQWTLAHQAAPGLFVEALVMALMKHHRILIQMAGEAELDSFVGALDEVLEGCRRVTGPLWQAATDLAKHAL